MPTRILAAAAVAVVLAGCGGEPAGAPAPPPLPPVAAQSGAPSVAPTPSPVAVPSSAAPAAPATPFVTSPDQAGAFAFVREYYKRLDAAYATGDVRPVAIMRTPTCSCRQAETNIRSIYDGGMHVVGDQHILDSLLLGPSGPAFSKVVVTLHSPRCQVFRGSVFVEYSSAAAGRSLLTLTINRGSWLFDDAIQDVRPVDK